MVYRKKLNRLLYFFCFFGCLCLTTQAYAGPQAGKQIDINSLHLYTLLNGCRDVMANSAYQKNLSAPLELVEDAIKKMHAIIQAFNSDNFSAYENRYRNLEIQYKFVNTCNLLKGTENLGPRHLRVLRAKFEEFDQYIQTYRLQEKNFLNMSEIDLLGKITQFNQTLLDNFLKNEYLGINFADKFLDVAFHRPVEFISKHPLAIMTALTAAGLFSWGVRVYQLPNNNPQVEVKQFRARNQYVGGPCGLHSVANLLAFIQGENDDQVRVQLADDNAFNDLSRNCANINGRVDDLDGQQVQNLLARNRVLANTILIDNPDALINLGIDNNFVPGSEQARADFNAMPSQPQSFIVNTGGHWLPFKFIKDASVLGGVRVLTAESYWNRNITAYPGINLIYQFLMDGQAVAPVH